MTSAKEARELILKAWDTLQLPDPTLGGLEAVQAHFAKETGYGRLEACNGNWGNVQAGKPPCGEHCQAEDSSPNPDGTSTRYNACFRRYDSAIDGIADSLRIMFGESGTKPAFKSAQSGDLLAFSRDLYGQGYYEGHGKTVEDRIYREAEKLEWNANLISKQLKTERATWLAAKEPESVSGAGAAITVGLAVLAVVAAKRAGFF